MVVTSLKNFNNGLRRLEEGQALGFASFCSYFYRPHCSQSSMAEVMSSGSQKA